eukprot:403342295
MIQLAVSGIQENLFYQSIVKKMFLTHKSFMEDEEKSKIKKGSEKTNDFSNISKGNSSQLKDNLIKTRVKLYKAAVKQTKRNFEILNILKHNNISRTLYQMHLTNYQKILAPYFSQNIIMYDSSDQNEEVNKQIPVDIDTKNTKRSQKTQQIDQQLISEMAIEQNVGQVRAWQTIEKPQRQRIKKLLMKMIINCDKSQLDKRLIKFFDQNSYDTILKQKAVKLQLKQGPVIENNSNKYQNDLERAQQEFMNQFEQSPISTNKQFDYLKQNNQIDNESNTTKILVSSDLNSNNEQHLQSLSGTQNVHSDEDFNIDKFMHEEFPKKQQ